MASDGLQKTCPKAELENRAPADGKAFSCGRIPVAPLPPITCSGKPAPKSDKGNVCADDVLESKVGEHKKSACDLHGQCNEIHDFRQVARCTKKLKKT